MIEFALQYAARGWRVFRLTGYKTPFKGSHGFKDGTTDAKVIERLWGEKPWANIGLATGFAGPPAAGEPALAHIVVLDADGPGGLAELVEAGRAHGGVPRTLTAKTSKGWHFYFALPRSGLVRLKKVTAPRLASGQDGLDVNADGSYVVAPPSVNAKTGFVYQWVNALDPIADMPDWLIAFCREKAAARKRGPAPITQTRKEGEAYISASGCCSISEARNNASPLLAHSPAGARVSGRVLGALRKGELTDFLGALRRIDAGCGYDQWFELGAAIHDFAPGDEGLAVFKAWSRSADGYATEEAQLACEAKWREYARKAVENTGQRLITKATVYALANQAPPLPADGGQAAGVDHAHVNGVHALPSIFTAPDSPGAKRIIFVDLDGDGNPRGTTTNAGLAIDGLGIRCRKDLFHEKLTIAGEAIDAWAGGLSDDVVLMLRQCVKARYGFDPGERNMRDAAVQRCLDNQYNPVCDYLDRLAWDRVPRIGKWVVDYLGAPDTPLNKEFGRLMLIAAVRRARMPGTKFDQIVVWEGKEGTNKSTALKILAGAENFSDQNILSAGDREQQEAMTGVWLYEIAEMAGLKKADIERVKQFASRTEDRARPAYGRLRVDRLRQCVFVGTTNKDIYLQSDTGNRRFWPIATGHIDVVRLAADRDQLWAEAARAEAAGEAIELHARYWQAAAEQQEARLEGDLWRQPIEAYLECRLKEPDTTLTDVLHVGLGLDMAQINQWAHNRGARVMRELGWERFLKREKSGRNWRYRKKTGADGDAGDKNSTEIS